ncbi:MAG: hypothetical protein FD167_1359 [bacterium]|nr:MAG: hypothetical protein FD167_1359 [bacterium]
MFSHYCKKEWQIIKGKRLLVNLKLVRYKIPRISFRRLFVLLVKVSQVFFVNLTIFDRQKFTTLLPLFFILQLFSVERLRILEYCSKG